MSSPEENAPVYTVAVMLFVRAASQEEADESVDEMLHVWRKCDTGEVGHIAGGTRMGILN